MANRVEIHPWALALLPHADTVYFVLEGTPKADSILTRIIETGRRASVCDVPSVTLWRDPGLRRVARGFLQGFGSEPPLVVVVADADWHANPRVERQALLLRECLRREGVNACVAAPPDHKGANGELLYKGVDDYLVGGGELDSLVVLDREAPIRLALFAAEDGTIRNSPTSLAPLLGCRRDATRVKGLLERHIENGEATVDRQLVLRREGQDRVVGWRGSRDDWPTITIAPDFRYTQRFVPLSKYDRVSAREKVASEVFAEEVVRVIREAAEARLWANGGRGELWRRVYDDALDATAERLGQKPETIRRDEVLAQMYAMARQTRDFVIVMSSGNFSERKIARMVGVSPATVKTALKK